MYQGLPCRWEHCQMIRLQAAGEPCTVGAGSPTALWTLGPSSAPCTSGAGRSQQHPAVATTQCPQLQNSRFQQPLGAPVISQPWGHPMHAQDWEIPVCGAPLQLGALSSKGTPSCRSLVLASAGGSPCSPNKTWWDLMYYLTITHSAMYM